MASVEPNLPVISIRTLREQVASQFSQPRLIARLTSFFGILSLLLAYYRALWRDGVQCPMPHPRNRRPRGSGSESRQYVWLVLKGSLTLIAWGILIGLPLTLAASRFLASKLYGASPYDPIVWSTSVLALGLSELVASPIPALRASSVFPGRAAAE